MNKKPVSPLLIEVISDDQLRLYQIQSQTITVIDDAALADYSGTSVYLYDPLYTATSRLRHPVKDWRLLEKVIAAEMESQLLQSPEHYQFAHANIADELWVSWIEKKRLTQLTQRFASYDLKVQGLVPLPLLYYQAKLGLPEKSEEKAFAIWSLQPIAYVINDDTIMAMETTQYQAWKATLGDGSAIVIDLMEAEPQSLFSIFPNDALQRLPNLWVQSASSKTSSAPTRLWLALGLLIVGGFTANVFFGYRQASHGLTELAHAQKQLLQETLPSVPADDPYTRMKIASQQVQAHGVNKLMALVTIFEQNNVAIESLTMNIANRQVTMAGQMNETILQQLDEAGFIWQESDNQWVISW